MDSRFRGNDRVGADVRSSLSLAGVFLYCHLRAPAEFFPLVIFGLDPEIQEYIRTSFILDSRFRGNDNTKNCQKMTKKGAPVGPPMAGKKKCHPEFIFVLTENHNKLTRSNHYIFCVG